MKQNGEQIDYKAEMKLRYIENGKRTLKMKNGK